MTVETSHDFNAVIRPCRIHSGEGALDALGAEIARAGARRAFVLCGRSVAGGTDLLDRIRAQAGDRLAGVFDRIGKDSPLPDVLAATEAARDAGADLLIAVGGGSVIQAARVVAIYLAEDGTPESLATQYPEDAPAVSPRLNAPKMPIFNVPTIGTTAQNWGGSPVKGGKQGHRLEYFDPKTRPTALFWDRAALATAPLSMVRATSGMLWWRSVMNMGYSSAPVLVDANRREVLSLATRVRDALARDEDSDRLRADLCLATWLQNQDADRGGKLVNTWASRVTYAFAIGIFHRHAEVAQGATTAALTCGVLRRLGHRDEDSVAAIATALGIPGMVPSAALADQLERDFVSMGLPVNLTQLGIPQDSAGPVLEAAMQNYNSDPRREFRRERDLLAEVLAGCW